MTRRPAPKILCRRQLRSRRNGWTVQEMIVVCAVIAVLTALIVPTYTNIKETQRRAKCQANVGGFAKMCHIYAMSKAGAANRANRLALPMGRIDDPTDATDQDNYLQIRTETYTDLRSNYGLSEQLAKCESVNLIDHDWMFDTGGSTMYMGLIYWGGRDDIVPDSPDDPEYYTPAWKDVHKRENPPKSGMWEEYTPTTNTLVTCMMYDVNATGNAGTDAPEDISIMPHVGSRCITSPSTEAPELDSVGMAVGYLDTSARWVPFGELKPLDQFQRIWYSPN